MKKKRVLILYYSYSSQTRKILQGFAEGLDAQNVEIIWQQLKPLKKLQFPLSSILSTLDMMLRTFFRKRIAIEPIEDYCFDIYDRIILAGPTWSYNPSGPVLSLLDTKGELFRNKKVVPFISCRGYWRLHYWYLRKRLGKLGADVLSPLVFEHVGEEPWLTIGVFLKLSGRNPEASKSWLSRYYSKYGHSRKQVAHAQKLGQIYGEQISTNAGTHLEFAPVKEV